VKPMSSPKVSVIIPNYNHGDYLRRRIETVLNQTYQDIEVIILDDSSSDNSRDIICAYAGHPLIIKTLFNETNSGSAFKQWQRGLELAKGEWIWIAESDDYADEKFLEITLNAVANNSNIGLVYCDSNIVVEGVVLNESFASLKNKRFKTLRWNEDHINSGFDEIENFLLLGGTINNTSAVLFNREMLLKSDPFDIELKYIGDKYAFVKVLAHSDVAYVKDRLNYFREPFNTKHADRLIFYFYEQFLLFDWVVKTLSPINRRKFFHAFYSNTSNSLFRGWNKMKVKLYWHLYRINSHLLLKSITHNIYTSTTSALRNKFVTNESF
jgi:glycosyltransferase involved in cell wall biosynthesis